MSCCGGLMGSGRIGSETGTTEMNKPFSEKPPSNNSCSHLLKHNRRDLLVEALFLSRMGDSSPSEDSDSEYVNSLDGLDQLHEDYNKQCTFTENSTSEDYMLGELIPGLSDVLHLQDSCEVISESDMSSDGISEVCALNRSATFPCSKKEMPDDGSHEHEPSENPAYNRSTSLPVPLKSALKGGRLKYGMPQKKLTVTWAHDVYDPPVTLVSHSVKGGQSSLHRSSRSGRKSNGSSSSNSSKHKHKGGKSSSRSSSSSSDTHKKHHHHRKHSSGHYESRTRPVECRDRLTPLINAMNLRSAAELDFSRALQDNIMCGTNYFMKSLTELHLPVAEAT